MIHKAEEDGPMKTNRKLQVLLAAASSLLIAAALVVGAAAAPDPFKGTWYSVDTDGSNQTLHVGGGPGGTYHVRYHDDGATVCGVDPVTDVILYAASGSGALTSAGNVLSGDVALYCFASPRLFYGNVTLTYSYNAGTDTLTDFWGIVWHR
jgi:hypothetical protein